MVKFGPINGQSLGLHTLQHYEHRYLQEAVIVGADAPVSRVEESSPHVKRSDINSHRARADHSRVRQRACACSTSGDCAVSSAVPVKSRCDLHSVSYEWRRWRGRAS